MINHESKRTWYRFSVEHNIDKMWPRLPWHEDHGEQTFAQRTNGVLHHATVYHDFQLSFASLRHIDCANTFQFLAAHSG